MILLHEARVEEFRRFLRQRGEYHNQIALQLHKDPLKRGQAIFHNGCLCEAECARIAFERLLSGQPIQEPYKPKGEDQCQQPK